MRKLVAGALTRQQNVRWDIGEFNQLARIAESEERDISEVIRFFVRWALPAYQSVGSIRGLQLMNVSEILQKQLTSITGKMLPPVASDAGKSMTRLKLRMEASQRYEAERASETKKRKPA